MLNVETTYAAFHTELRKPNIGIALAWRIVRTDGETYYFTDHDKALTIPEVAGDSPGMTFSSLATFSAQARRQSQGLTVDNITLHGLIDGGSPTIGFSEAEVLGEIWMDADVDVWLAIWTNPSVGLLPLNKGNIGPMAFRTHTFEAEMRSIAERLQGPVHRTYGVQCSFALGDSDCQVNLDPGGSPGFRNTTTIEEVTNNREFHVVETGRDTSYFQYGLAEFITGRNAGLKREVIIHEVFEVEGERVVLLVPMPFDIELGDQVQLTAGCDKSFDTCKVKFSNQARHGGFKELPLSETVLETPNAK